MNEHVELLVAVRQNVALNILKIFLYVITVLCVAVALTGIIPIFPIFIAIITGFLAYFVSLRVDIEYEYTLTDKEIDIDMVLNKQKRKHVTNIDLTKMDIMAPIESDKLADYKNIECKTEDYSSKIKESKNIFVMYYDGQRRILIEPDERLYKAIYNCAPRKVYNS